MTFTLTAYDVLIGLYTNDRNAVLHSATVAEIIDMVDASQSTVYATIDNLLGANYIAEGVRVQQAKTYYITAAGVTHLIKAFNYSDEKELLEDLGKQ